MGMEFRWTVAGWVVCLILGYSLKNLGGTSPSIESSSSQPCPTPTPDPYPHLPNLFGRQPSINYWCTLLEYLPKPTWIEKVQATNGIDTYDMWVYSKDQNELVSNKIRDTGAWEIGHQNAVASRMAEVKNKYQKLGRLKNSSELSFLDLGTQIGSFSFRVASLGYHTVSFEAHPKMALVYRYTRCEHLDWNMTHYNNGVGEYKNCGITVDMLVCDSPGEVAVDIIQLDRTDLLKYLFGVAKIDTQASEGMIMKGGYNFFKRAKIPYIITEFWPFKLLEEGSDPIELLNSWHSLGYEVRQKNFEGNVIQPENFYNFTYDTKFLPNGRPWWTNIFLIYKEYIRM